MTDLIKDVSERLRLRQWKMASAESCTGGMIAAAMTDLAGSSDIFDRGFVTYSNQAKIDMLGVSPETLETYGAVSEQTASEMVAGALKHSCADIAVSVTGIAGPSGGSAEKPVGLVFIAVAQRGAPPTVHRHIFDGSRHDVRQKTCTTALTYILNLISKELS